MPDVFTATNGRHPIRLPTITTDPNLPRGKVGLLTNFCLYPEGIKLENQEENEIIILFLRRNFSTNIQWIVSTVLLLFAPLLLTLVPFPISTFLPASYLTTLTLFYYLLVFGFFLISFTNWFYNISIVTTQRVIDLDYANLTYKHVAGTTIPNVKDVSYIQSGFIRSYFDYGNVLVQTEAEVTNFMFDSVPHPAQVVDIILDLIRGIKND